jgi:hypothetical protein
MRRMVFSMSASSSSRDRRQRLAARIFLPLLLAPLFMLFLGASPAGAAPSSTIGSNGTQTALICSSSAAATSTATDNLLPVNRWSGAIGNEHTRLPGGLLSSVTNAPNTINRSIFVGGMTSIGAAEWQLGVATTEAASQFCFANTVGQDANSLAATLGNAVSSSGLVAILAVVGFLAVLWKASRGRESPFRQVGKILIVVGIFSAMVAAATASAPTTPSWAHHLGLTSASSTSTGPPAFFSPAWFITTAYNAISNIAAAPASAIASGANSITGGAGQSAISAQDPLSCDWYTQELIAEYQATYTNANSYAYVVPTSLNALWMQAAIPAYTSEQFGNNNNFGPLVYCHLLEDQAGISPATQMKVALASGALSGDQNLASFPKPLTTSLAWNGAITNNQEDESMVAWAACQSPNSAAGFVPTEWNLATGSTVPSAWTTVTNPNIQQGTNADTTVSGADCQVFWSANAPASGGQFGDAASGGPFNSPSGAPWTGQNSNPDYSVFNFGDNPTTIAGASNASVSGQEIGNFLSNLHGTSNASAMATSFIFLLSSTVIMIIFMVLGLAVIIAKLGLLLSMTLMPVMLLLALMPGGSGNGKLGAYCKHLFGLILFATSAGILLSMISVITGMLADIGVAAAGQGSLFALIWVAIAPVTAVVVIHMFFTKVLKSPSPFKPSSAMAYGAALGGFGGGLAGADLFSHLRSRGGQAVSVARGRMSGKQGRSGPNQRGRGRQSMGGSGSGGGSGTGGVSGVNPTGVTPAGTSPSGAGGAVAAGVATGAVSQSMFKRERRQRRVESEQFSADRFAASERVSRRTKRLEVAKGSLLNPGFAAGAAVGGAQERFKESVDRAKERFNQTDVGTKQRHRIQGSLLTLGAAAGGAGRAVLKVPKVAKYGAMGIGGAAALGLGAPVLAGVGAAYGAKKLYNFSRNAPIRQAQNLGSFRQYQEDQTQAAEAARKAQVDAASTAETERKAAEALTAEQQARAQADQEQASRVRLAQERRVRDWQRGVVGPASDGPQGPQRNDGPSGPGR